MASFPRVETLSLLLPSLFLGTICRQDLVYVLKLTILLHFLLHRFLFFLYTFHLGDFLKPLLLTFSRLNFFELLLLRRNYHLLFKQHRFILFGLIKPVVAQKLTILSKVNPFDEVSADLQKVLRRDMNVGSRIRNFVPLIGLLRVVLCCLDPILPRLLEMLRAEKCCFEGIGVLNAKFLEQYNSSGGVFVFFEGHLAIIGTEDRTKMDHAFWNVPNVLIWQSDSILVAEVPTSVHEDVHISTVTVHVTGKHDATRVGIRLRPQDVVKFDQ